MRPHGFYIPPIELRDENPQNTLLLPAPYVRKISTKMNNSTRSKQISQIFNIHPAEVRAACKKKEHKIKKEQFNMTNVEHTPTHILHLNREL